MNANDIAKTPNKMYWGRIKTIYPLNIMGINVKNTNIKIKLKEK